MELSPATVTWLNRWGGDPKLGALRDEWKNSLLLPGFDDPCDSALHELADYFHISLDEARARCEHWEEDSVHEWERAARDTPDGLLDFYRTTQSWIFDTVWYHAQQCSYQQFPESVAIAYGLQHPHPGHMLDLGAGPGSTGLFFHRLGWQVSMADISTSMQEFAKWRFTQRRLSATFYDTSREELPADTFDLITAIDVVAHIPNWTREVARLHRSLKVGGLFVFNVDSRPRARENQWHLYEYHYPIIRPMRSAGFRRLPKIEFFYVYQKVLNGAGRRYAAAFYDTCRHNLLVSKMGDIVRTAKS